MNKEKLLEMFKDKKIQNYSYNIFFFVVFSFFTIFAIQPNLSTAFRLQKELQDLRLQNKKSEEAILQIVNYQSLMEGYRDNLTVLDEAVPSSPELAKVVNEISKTASDSGLIVNSLTIESIGFKGDSGTDIGATPGDDELGNLTNQPDLMSFTITVEGSASFSQITQFLNQVIGQRRLKTYDSINLSTENSNENMVITILVRTYYL